MDLNGNKKNNFVVTRILNGNSKDFNPVIDPTRNKVTNKTDTKEQ